MNDYLDLLEKALTGTLYRDQPMDPWSGGKYDEGLRRVGKDWPSAAPTMIGVARMRNLRRACELAILKRIPGDFIETGVWRGGACIYMRGILRAFGVSDRRVFVADSFAGLPPPSADYPDDANDQHHLMQPLAISRAEVEDNFRRYGLLDERVVFLEGWFKDTLPSAPIDKISVLRVDGDMYESTWQALEALYDKVSLGGAVIIDDYCCLSRCHKATNDFRKDRKISSPMLPIDGMGAWWVKN